MARDYCKTKATGNGLLDRLIAAQLQSHSRHESAAREVCIAGEARARATFAQDESLRQKVSEFQMAPFSRCPSGQSGPRDCAGMHAVPGQGSPGGIDMM